MSLITNLVVRHFNKIDDIHVLDVGRVDLIYSHYQYFSEFLGTDIVLSKEKLGELLSIVYAKLGSAMSEDQFGFLTERVIRTFVDEAKDGHVIDEKWMVDHIWYYVTLARNYSDTSKYEKLIPLLQDELYRKYSFKEEWKDKTKRKINTYCQIKNV